MSIATLIRRMSDAGAPPEAIALAVEEIEALQATIDARRTADRDRKRAQRERQKTADVTGQSEDSHGTVTANVTDKGSPEVSPQTPLPNPSKTAPLSPPKNRGTRLPDDWKPNEVDVAFARSLGHTEGRVAAIAEQFRDHWLAAPGQRGVKLDWSATWRNWCRREGVQKGAPKYVSASGYEYRGGIEAVIREAERRGDMETYWKAKGDLKRAAA